MKDNKGITHNNCFINDKNGKEWCFIDHLGLSWDYCSRGDFKIYSKMLIKNIENKQTTDNKTNEYCLFSLKNLGSKILSVECDVLLRLKKLNPDVVNVNGFMWYWLNESQIKNSVQMCISPIVTSIISDNNSRIDYFGFTELRKCLTDDDLSLGVSNLLFLHNYITFSVNKNGKLTKMDVSSILNLKTALFVQINQNLYKIS